MKKSTKNINPFTESVVPIKTPKVYKNPPPTPEELELWAIVKRHKQGGQTAVMDMMDKFHDFLEQFIRIIKMNILILSSSTQRHFISLFIGDKEVVYGLRSKKLSTHVKEAAFNAAYHVYCCFKIISIEDIRQDMAEVIVKAMNYYKGTDENIYWLRYFIKSFICNFARKVKENMRDPLVSMSAENLISIDDDDENLQLDSRYGNINLQNASVDTIEHLGKERISALGPMDGLDFGNGELGINWVQGITCNDLFAKLWPIERYYLKLFYYDEMTIPKAARMAGISMTTMKRRKKSILQKLADFKTLIDQGEDISHIHYREYACFLNKRRSKTP